VVGLELGQALSRLGVRVKIIGRSGSIGALHDDVIKTYATHTFQQELDLQLNTKVTEIERVSEGVKVVYENENGEQTTDTFNYVLAATGRRSNVDRLGIENTSLNLDAHGAPLFDASTLQTQTPHVFIVGDANSEIPLLHEAADEGKIAGDNAGRFPDVIKGHRRTPLSIVFTEPQIANFGLSLNDLKSRYAASGYVVGEVSFEGQGRSRVMGKNKGLLRLYAEQGSGLLLGAEMFGPAAEHIGHLLAWVVQQGLTVSEILDMPFYHPVIEEGVRTALRDARSKLEPSTVVAQEPPQLTSVAQA
ncbi:MAG: FAD-dependent oxidoreductase, partial [Halieaceae bacterium]|nr:FAD-dependent oxidoreductase [Halieaceae bacterium]